MFKINGFGKPNNLKFSGRT